MNTIDVFQIGESKIKVLTKEKIIELKRRVDPPRNKDQLDIVELSKRIKRS